MSLLYFVQMKARMQTAEPAANRPLYHTQMTNIGLPVPPGFIVTTATCLQYFDSSPECVHSKGGGGVGWALERNKKCSSSTTTRRQRAYSMHFTARLPFGLVEEVAEAVKQIEQQTGREFGNPSNPLLFSVRSGAAISMPGMMDTGA